MVTKTPKMLTANKRKLTETFDFVHNVMSIPHHIIVRFPQVMRTTPGAQSWPSACRRSPAFQHHAARCDSALLFVQELDQMHSGAEGCVTVIFLLPIFLSR